MRIVKKVFFAVMAAAMVLATLSCSSSASGGGSEPVPKNNYTGIWSGINAKDETVVVQIGEKNITLTVTDKNGNATTKLIDNENYTVAADGTIKVAGKDKDDNSAETEYKFELKNGSLSITDGNDNEVANCEKISDRTTVPTKTDYIGIWTTKNSNDNTITTTITNDKITITLTDSNDDKKTLVDNADYKIAPDGIIAVKG